MKKKQTVGVFLILAVALVASIVTVDGADAAPPYRNVDVEVYWASNGDGTYNLTPTVSWSGVGVWKCELEWYKRFPGQAASPIEADGEGMYIFDHRTPDYTFTQLPTITVDGCGYKYGLFATVMGKNGKPLKKYQLRYDYTDVLTECP
jgi:hypothetical protein